MPAPGAGGLDRAWVRSALAIPAAAVLCVGGTLIALFTADLGSGASALAAPLFGFLVWCAAVSTAGGLAAAVGAASRASRAAWATVCALLAVPSFGLVWLTYDWLSLWSVLPLLLGLACLAPLAVVLTRRG